MSPSRTATTTEPLSAIRARGVRQSQIDQERYSPFSLDSAMAMMADPDEPEDAPNILRGMD